MEQGLLGDRSSPIFDPGGFHVSKLHAVVLTREAREHELTGECQEPETS